MGLLSVYKNIKPEGLVAKQRKACNKYNAQNINSDNREQKYVQLSNSLIETYKFATCLQYEYTQVAVDLFCEKVSLVHVWWWFAFTFHYFSCILKNALHFYNLDP